MQSFFHTWKKKRSPFVEKENIFLRFRNPWKRTPFFLKFLFAYKTSFSVFLMKFRFWVQYQKKLLHFSNNLRKNFFSLFSFASRLACFSVGDQDLLTLLTFPNCANPCNLWKVCLKVEWNVLFGLFPHCKLLFHPASFKPEEALISNS